MKSTIITLLITTSAINVCLAQESRKTDDALVLEYYQNQRFSDALTYLKRIYTEPITNVKELTRLAYTADIAHLLPQAEAYYQQLYNIDSTNVTVLFNIANINQRRGTIAKAETFYKKLVLADTLNFNGFNRLGQLYYAKGDFKSAAYYYEKANQINPTDADLATDLSEVCVLLNETTKAAKILAVAINADPENITLQQALLKINYLNSKWTETAKTGEQLFLLGDSTTATVSKLGIAYYQTKNYLCGVKVLSSIPETDQTEVSAYYIAACYKLLNDPKKAIVHFNKAVKLSISKNTATYYNEIADSYETLRLFIKAQDNYQKGLLYEEKPLTFYYMATMFDSKLKDSKKALKYYKKYIASMPGKTEKEYKNYSQSRIIELSRRSALTIH